MDRSDDTRWLPAFFPTFFTLCFFPLLSRLPSRSTERIKPAGSATRLLDPDFLSPILSTGIVILSHAWQTYFPRNPPSRGVKSIASSCASMKPDSIADGTDRRRGAQEKRGCYSGRVRKKKRNSRINEIAIIDTPILALKDPLAPCTSVRDIIDPAHAIARIPLRFN